MINRIQLLTNTFSFLEWNKMYLFNNINTICMNIIFNKEVFVKHEKAPTAPRFEGVLTISCMPIFWKIQDFWHFCQLLVAETVKRHINRPRPFIWAYSQVSTTIRYTDTAWKAYVSKNRWVWAFWPISAIFGGWIWSKVSKGTSTGQDLSYEPIPRCLRPSVTEKLPGTAYVSKTRCI